MGSYLLSANIQHTKRSGMRLPQTAIERRALAHTQASLSAQRPSAAEANSHPAATKKNTLIKKTSHKVSQKTETLWYLPEKTDTLWRLQWRRGGRDSLGFVGMLTGLELFN